MGGAPDDAAAPGLVTDPAVLVLRWLTAPDPSLLHRALSAVYGPALELSAGRLRAVDALVRGAAPNGQGPGRHRAEA